MYDMYVALCHVCMYVCTCVMYARYLFMSVMRVRSSCMYECYVLLRVCFALSLSVKSVWYVFALCMRVCLYVIVCMVCVHVLEVCYVCAYVIHGCCV